MDTLALAIGVGLAIFFALLGIVILVKIWQGTIDLAGLLSEDGKASMSRFQFLVFTFVIALSLFLVVVGTQPPSFPEIPAGVFALLGISGGSFVISKGIQTDLKVRLGAIQANEAVRLKALDSADAAVRLEALKQGAISGRA